MLLACRRKNNNRAHLRCTDVLPANAERHLRCDASIHYVANVCSANRRKDRASLASRRNTHDKRTFESKQTFPKKRRKEREKRKEATQTPTLSTAKEQGDKPLTKTTYSNINLQNTRKDKNYTRKAPKIKRANSEEITQKSFHRCKYKEEKFNKNSPNPEAKIKIFGGGARELKKIALYLPRCHVFRNAPTTHFRHCYQNWPARTRDTGRVPRPGRLKKGRKKKN